MKGQFLVRFIGKLVFLAVLAAALAACKGHSHDKLFSHGDLFANGTGITDTAAIGGEQLYMLRNIIKDRTYTLRTQIAPGGSVQMNIYESEAAFNNGLPPIKVQDPVYLMSPYDTTREVVFNAQTPGDYALVVSGVTATGGFDAVFLQDLRLMSAGTEYIITLETVTGTASFASGTVPISPGYMQVYSSPITTPGFSISLFSTLVGTTTSTVSYPQLFVYGDMYNDHDLTIRNLLYSITSNTTEFIISTLTTSATPTDPNVYSTSTTSYTSGSAVISNVTFSGNAPFILVRGVFQANYTLTVGP